MFQLNASVIIRASFFPDDDWSIQLKPYWINKGVTKVQYARSWMPQLK